jgi:hypothetical protein
MNSYKKYTNLAGALVAIALVALTPETKATILGPWTPDAWTANLYHFDTATGIATDSSGNGRDIWDTWNLSSTTGYFGQGQNAAAVGVGIWPTAPTSVSSSTFSLSGIFKFDNVAANGTENLISTRTDYTSLNSVLRVYGNGMVDFTVNRDDGFHSVTSAAGTITDNTWYQITAIGTYGEQWLYVNGDLVASAGGLGTASANANAISLLSQWNDAVGAPFRGVADEIIVANEVVMVPEPTTISLVCLGGLMLPGLRAFRRRP